MREFGFDREALEEEFNKRYENYQRMGEKLCTDLESSLKKAEIEFVSVFYRIKKFDAFRKKVERRGYREPFEECLDICGVRIIYYFYSDLYDIEKVIFDETEVVDTIDKSGIIETDRFGYRSFHYIVKLKDKWLKMPTFRELDGLKAEVQVMTVTMHSWAEIQRKLAYKKIEDIPNQFSRKFLRISSLFEMADDMFDEMRVERERYGEEIIIEAEERGRLDEKLPMNLDNLQAFLDFHFPQRKRELEGTSRFLDEIMNHGISMKFLVNSYDNVKDIIPKIEMELLDLYEQEYNIKEMQWWQEGAANAILELTHDSFWEMRKEEAKLSKFNNIRISIADKWRKKLSEGR